MGKLKFKLGAKVRLVTSDEVGKIIGRGEWITSEPQYFVRYKAADGKQTEAWWGESALASA